MSALVPSVICCPIDRSEFLTGHEETLFVSANNSSWIEHAKGLFGLEPLAFKIGSIFIKALMFVEGHGLSAPDRASLDAKAALFGIDLSSDAGISHLVTRLKQVGTRLFLSLPLKIFHLTSSNFQLISYKKSFCVELSRIESPEPSISINPALHHKINCLSHSPHALADFRARFSLGSCRLVDEALILKVSSAFFRQLSSIETFLASPHPIGLIPDRDYIQFVARKTTEDPLELYALFSQIQWRGSYKTVMLGVKITDRLAPIGVSISDTTDSNVEALKELKLRQHPHISRVMTPLYCHWEAENQTNMIHSWACHGTLFNFLRSSHPKTLKELDIIALQMIEALGVFHENDVVHKDLTSENFLIDGAGDTIKAYLNDVGSSSIKTDEADLTYVATHGYNLAPELTARCIATKGKFWNDSFHMPFTFDDWVMSEKFQLACLLVKLYTGKTPFEVACPRDEIIAAYPLKENSFTDFISDKDNHLLDQYLEEIDQIRLKSFYAPSFPQFYAAQPGNEAYDWIFLTAEQEAKIMDEFTEIFKSERRRELTPFLASNHAQIRDIYKKAFRRMRAMFQRDFYGALNTFIATNKTHPLELISEPPEKIANRLIALEPLLDLDPAKRPPLAAIKAALQTAIHLNP